jgi:hypothetical protein
MKREIIRLAHDKKKDQRLGQFCSNNTVDDELCPFGCKEKNQLNTLHCTVVGPNKIMAMFGIQLTGVNDLDNIYLEARE